MEAIWMELFVLSGDELESGKRSEKSQALKD